MFLTTETVVIAETSEDAIKFFTNPMFIYCVCGVFIAWFALYSGKNPKVKPIAMILYAIYFISFLFIVKPF